MTEYMFRRGRAFRKVALGFFVAVVLVVAGCGSIPDDGDPVPVDGKGAGPTARKSPLRAPMFVDLAALSHRTATIAPCLGCCPRGGLLGS